ncbi:MAG TPA: EamA family transporter [Candidatus Dormibacteraeota bacterium]|nr:EamA family transporter [Candidatus Dormibacteraeota bacterium]
MSRFTPRRLQLPLILGMVWLTFGSAPVGARVGVTHVPPLLFGGARFALAGLILLAVLAVGQRGRLRLSRRELAEAALIGAGLVGAGQGAVNWASTELLPGVVAMFIATAPVCMALLERLLLGRRIPPLGAAGLVMGMAGTLLLVLPGARTSVPPGAALALAGGVLSWSAASLFAGRSRIGRRPWLLTGLQMLIGGGIQLAVGLILGEPAAFRPGSAFEPEVVAWFAYLLLGSAVLGFVGFTWLLANASPVVANSQAFVAPVVAILLGRLLLAEPLTPRALVAAGIGLAGVALLVVAQARVRPAIEAELSDAA